MHDGFYAVTPDGISLNVESGFQATKDYRRADNLAPTSAGKRAGAVLFRKIANPRSSQRHAIRLPSGDPAVLVASSAKIQRDLGWQPQYTDLRSIVETAWRWHSTHPRGYAK